MIAKCNDVWKHCLVKYLSPLDVTHLRATSKYFRYTIEDAAMELRLMLSDERLLAVARAGHGDIVDLLIRQAIDGEDDAEIVEIILRENI